MNITVIGGGYVGVTTATILAKVYGHNVVCVEPDTDKLSHLQQGVAPFYEPKLDAAIKSAITKSRLLFVPQIVKQFGKIQIIAVGTPAMPDGSTDLSQVITATSSVAELMDQETVIAIKSTVPPGTCDMLIDLVASILARRGVTHTWSLVSNPEFLSEGSAIHDATNPDRIIVGGYNDLGFAAMSEVYGYHTIIEMDIRAAELTKYVANAMLATRITLMNQVANLADVMQIDVRQVMYAVGTDSRIGHTHMTPGIGYGGSCFPKDIASLVNLSERQGVSMSVLDACQQANTRQPKVLCDKIVRRFGDDLRGRKFAIWGVSFKPDTNDMRAAPSLPIIKFLVDNGATVVIHDPQSRTTCAAALMNVLLTEQQTQVSYVSEPLDGVVDSDAVLLLTDWHEYHYVDTNTLPSVMKTPCFFDGRNHCERDFMINSGIEYYSIGQG